jgi:hypothetical protein
MGHNSPIIRVGHSRVVVGVRSASIVISMGHNSPIIRVGHGRVVVRVGPVQE